MSAIESATTRSIFGPSKKSARETGKIIPPSLKRNSESRKNELEAFSKNDSNVDINEGIKDFSRIKKVADQAPSIDNSEKIAKLKSQIEKGEYVINYDDLTDKILEQEF